MPAKGARYISTSLQDIWGGVELEKVCVIAQKVWVMLAVSKSVGLCEGVVGILCI